MKFLHYLFDISRFLNRTKEKKKKSFIASTIFNLVVSMIIFLLIIFGLACFNIDGIFVPSGSNSSSGENPILLIFGIVLILATIVALIKNIPYQIILAVVGIKRSKEEGTAFLVCGIIAIFTIVALFGLTILQFIGL